MTNEITPTNDIQQEFTNSNKMFCTIKDDGSRKQKTVIYNAVANPNHSLSDFIGKQINVVHVIAHEVEMENEQTKELELQFRVILIDDKGESYASVSSGITQALKTIFNIVGQPPYMDEPLSVTVAQKKSRNGFKFLTLELI